MIGLQEAIRNSLRQYASASGRASRAEFWWWWGALLLLQALFGERPLGAVASLALLLPSITVLVRRLHDLDRSGWFAFVALIPGVGLLILLVVLALPGTDGSNRYGAPRTPAVPPQDPWRNPWQNPGASGDVGGSGLGSPGTPGGNWDDTPRGSGGGWDVPPPPLPPTR